VVRGLFVTGTDTGVGKTVVSAALMLRYRDALPLRYWKPIQTGIEQDDDTAEVRRLGACPAEEIFVAGERLKRPVSPHLAAKLAGTPIVLTPLLDRMRGADEARAWIVEGAGGALVPINDTELMTDLMTRLALPIVIVARSTLGTINHTLMTIEALRHRKLSPAAVVMAGPPNADNREAIEHYGRVPVIGQLPHFESLTPERLSTWATTELDRDGALLELMR
jgi:dethiobiotin synthase